MGRNLDHWGKPLMGETLDHWGKPLMGGETGLGEETAPIGGENPKEIETPGK